MLCAEYLCDLLDRLVKVVYNENEDGGRALFLRCKRHPVKMKNTWKVGDETMEQKEEKNVNLPISDWIDNLLDTDIPDDVAAFCFNLYEDGDGIWSMELVGADRFDTEDEDWPCDETTDFGSRENPYEWEMDCDWEDALAYIVNALKEYLTYGKHAELLKSKNGIGVGFVDGDLEILYSKS